MMYICLIRAHPHPRFGEFVQPRQKPWNVSLVGLHMLTKKASETMRHNEVLKLTGVHPTTIVLKSKYCLEISEARERLKISGQPFLTTVFEGCVFHILLPRYCTILLLLKKRFPENFGIKKKCTLETFGH